MVFGQRQQIHALQKNSDKMGRQLTRAPQGKRTCQSPKNQTGWSNYWVTVRQDGEEEKTEVRVWFQELDLKVRQKWKICWWFIWRTKQLCPIFTVILSFQAVSLGIKKCCLAFNTTAAAAELFWSKAILWVKGDHILPAFYSVPIYCICVVVQIIYIFICSFKLSFICSSTTLKGVIYGILHRTQNFFFF